MQDSLLPDWVGILSCAAQVLTMKRKVKAWRIPSTALYFCACSPSISIDNRELPVCVTVTLTEKRTCIVSWKTSLYSIMENLNSNIGHLSLFCTWEFCYHKVHLAYILWFVRKIHRKASGKKLSLVGSGRMFVRKLIFFQSFFSIGMVAFFQFNLIFLGPRCVSHSFYLSLAVVPCSLWILIVLL